MRPLNPMDTAAPRAAFPASDRLRVTQLGRLIVATPHLRKSTVRLRLQRPEQPCDDAIGCGGDD